MALDFDEPEKALFVVQKTSGLVLGYKIGPRLFFQGGSSLLSKIKKFGKVFLDFKFFDIPSTTLASVRSAFELGADSVTVHAQAGEETLKQLAELESQLRRKRDFQILAVTILTSFSQNTLPPLLRQQKILSHVESLSDMAVKSGLRGIVCSGMELAHLRKRHPEAYLLIPGIRLPSESFQDQSRVFSPEQALRAGASALVMGRSISRAEDPAQVCVQLQKSLLK